jgi:phage FluMu protein Com
MRVTVHCDNCGYEQHEQKIKTWHNVKCPFCKDSIMIDDADIKFYRATVLFKAINDIARFFMPNAPTKNIRVSSAELRKRG